MIPPARPDGAARLIWLHGASNGELTAARPVIEAITRRARHPHLVVTANTGTGRDLVAGWGLPRVTAQLAPYDHARFVTGFLDAIRPDALVVVENEIWPNRFTLAARRGIPVFMLSARLSARSAARWARLPGFARQLMGCVTWLAPQDEASADRFVRLGLDPGRLGPVIVLKSLAKTTSSGGLPLPRDKTLLAASTHAGEDEIVLDAFLSARAGMPDLHLILAPRHPRRGNDIAAAIRARGLGFAMRSRGEAPKAGCPVYLADTLGEMDLWYPAAGMCFVGGSLVDRGGHTPFEPAAHGSAILHGPHVGNAAPAYDALAEHHAAVRVTDAQSLAMAVTELAAPDRQAALSGAARTALAGFAAAADLGPFLNALEQAIGQSGAAAAAPVPDARRR